MPRIEFTPQLASHIDCPGASEFEVNSLGDLLDAVFDEYPLLRGYVLDDQGIIRKHVAVFVDGVMVRNRDQLDVTLDVDSEVFVLQALSGG